MGRRGTCPPAEKIYPFMLNTAWFTKYKEEFPGETVRVYSKDPAGFDKSG